MISNKDGSKSQDGQFKSAALAKAPNIMSSAIDSQEFLGSKVTSSITRKMFFSGKIASSHVSASSASTTGDGSVADEQVSTSGILQNGLDHSSALQQKPFPQTLMELLSQADPDVVGWLPSGTAFIVRCPQKFVDSVLPKFFKQTKLTSFHRQLNLYGFRRIIDGPDIGAYHHELFQRDEPELCRTIQRKKKSRKRCSAESIQPSNRVSPLEADPPQEIPCMSSITLPSSLVTNVTIDPAGLALHPFVATSSNSENVMMPLPPSNIPSSSNVYTSSLTGYSILVCDHKTKKVAEVSQFATIPCDLEAFAQGVGTLLAHGIEQHKQNNLS